MTDWCGAAVLPRSFYQRSPVEVAPDLIGRVLVHEALDGVAAGTIVEVEAYAEGDRASHAFRGKTRRNAVMFGPPGHAYVYRSHGIHWCANAVCRQEGIGEAVLIRALMPVAGRELMRARRGTPDDRILCAGPGRLCQALGITGDFDGADLCGGPLRIVDVAREPIEVVAGPRIGISVDMERPWRFCLRGSPWLSRRSP